MDGGRRREKGGWPGGPRCDLVQFMNSAGGQSEKERDNSNLGENFEAAQSVKVSRRNRRERNMSPLLCLIPSGIWKLTCRCTSYLLDRGLHLLEVNIHLKIYSTFMVC